MAVPPNQINANALDPDVSSYKYYPKGDPIQTIRSLHNGQVLTVTPQEGHRGTYAVRINDKCLNVYQDSYGLRNCQQPGEDVQYHPQYFEAKRIMNEVDAQKYKGVSADGMGGTSNSMGGAVVDYAATGSYGTSYPYTAFVHRNTRQCLTLDDDGAFMAQCDPANTRQHWQVSNQIHSCNL